MISNEEAVAAMIRSYELINKEESILTIVLKGQLIIETEIERLISTVYFDSSVFDLNRMQYPQKLDLLVAIGIFTKDEIAPYREFNKIRRKYAHDLMYELKKEDLNKVVDSLSRKHMVFFGSEKLSLIEDPHILLKSLLLPLLFMIILQNSQDKVFDKKPHEPMLISEMEYYKQMVLSKERREHE
ncbi:hypothetical protein [Planococcus sp. S3-L1]|uniref:hypothetical protein n=1 Tax=Planococcus sp. S3-L1 TaxID=3046200 RepID=UPI0024BBDFB9|nr:hypothetical protein [Planococcus sp. S3-L1]MDJ0332283.1 hypothetical protein [Planococcus sp. S3-L1]